MKTTVEGSEEGGYLPTGPIDPTLLAAVAGDPSTFMAPSGQGIQVNGIPTSIVSRSSVLLELAAIKTAIRKWYEKQPDEVIREAAAYSARLTELWTELRQLEPYDRSYTQLRTMQVQPVLDEIDRQYRFNQSRIAIARQDLDLARYGGMT